MAKQDKTEQAPTEELLTATQVAEKLGVDERSFRSWLRRRQGGTLPKGARYGFKPSQVESIKKAYGERKGSQVVVEFDEAAETN